MRQMSTPTPNNLTEATIDELKVILAEVYGLHLDYSAVESMALSLATYFDLLSRMASEAQATGSDAGSAPTVKPETLSSFQPNLTD